MPHHFFHNLTFSHNYSELMLGSKICSSLTCFMIFFFMLFLLLGPFFPITFFLSSVDPSYFCIILFLEDFNLVKKPSYEYLLLILKSFSVVSFSLSPPWVIEARLLCLDYHCISIILHSSCHILKVHRFFEITESVIFTKNSSIWIKCIINALILCMYNKNTLNKTMFIFSH